MPDRSKLFNSIYGVESQTESTEASILQKTPFGDGNITTQATLAEARFFPQIPIEAERYGIGKARRVVIRGRISRE